MGFEFVNYKEAEFAEYDYHVNIFSDTYGPASVKDTALNELASDMDSLLTIGIGDYDKIPSLESLTIMRNRFDDSFGEDGWISTPGNHEAQYIDGIPASLDWYFNTIGFGAVDYEGINVAYRVVGNDVYVLMDSALKHYTDEMLTELNEVLMTLIGYRYVFLFTHVPFIDPLPVQENIEDHAITIDEDAANRFQDIIESNAVTAVFFSHQHSYETWTKNGVLYIITAGGGSPLDELDEEYHYVKLYVGEYIRIERTAVFPTLPQRTV